MALVIASELAMAGSASSTGLPRFFLWIGLLILAVIVLTIVLMAMRRRLLAEGRNGSDAGMLEQLRSLRTHGQISDAEFEEARRRLIARLKGEDPKASGAPGEPGLLRAPPGFDLTGEALPSQADDQDSR